MSQTSDAVLVAIQPENKPVEFVKLCENSDGRFFWERSVHPLPMTRDQATRTIDSLDDEMMHETWESLTIWTVRDSDGLLIGQVRYPKDWGEADVTSWERPVVAHMDPEEGIPMNCWADPRGIFRGQPVPANIVALYQYDMEQDIWTVTI